MAQAVGCRITNLPGVHPNSSDRSGLPSNGPSGAYPRYSEQADEPRRRPELCSANQKPARVKGKAANRATSKAGVSDYAERYDDAESSDARLHETGRIDQARPVRLKTVTPSNFANLIFQYSNRCTAETRIASGTAKTVIVSAPSDQRGQLVRSQARMPTGPAIPA